MGGVLARRVVASVEHVLALGDGADLGLIAEAMGLHLLVAEAERSVALIEAGRGPLPAVVRSAPVNLLQVTL